MRALLLVAAATTILGLGALACSSDDKGSSTSNTTKDGGTASEAGSSTPGTLPPGFACDPNDKDVPCAPDGSCKLKTTDYTSGKKIEDLARSDAPAAIHWTTPENALSVDGKFATVTLAEGQESTELRVSDFGFTIPSDAIIWGMEIELKRQAPQTGIADVEANLDIPSKPTQFRFFADPWPKDQVGTHHYGQPTDTWKADVFPSDFNAAGFGITFTVKRSDDAVTGPVTAQVESLKAAIYFCPAK